MKEVHFVNKIVKQGNSLCVRIPNSIIKEGKLKGGMEVLMSIIPKSISYKYDPLIIEENIKLADQVKELDKYNQSQKRIFLILNFQFLEDTLEKGIENKEWVRHKYNEFGKGFMDNFLEFEKTFNREAFITEKDGTTVLKPKYRN